MQNLNREPSRAFLACAIAVMAALAGGSPSAQQATVPAAPSVNDFTRWDEFGKIKISPDGEFVALTTGKHGRGLIAFIDLKNKKLSSGVRAPDPLEIYDFHWVSPTRVIYEIAQRYPGRATPSVTGEIFAINRDGGGHRQIYGWRAGVTAVNSRFSNPESSTAHAEIISLMRDDADHILIAEHPWKQVGMYWRPDPDAFPRITRLNVQSGDKQDLGTAPLRSASLLTDQADRVRFAVGYNNQFKLAVSWRPEPNSAWTQFDLAGFREESVAPVHFSKDNDSVWLTGVREGESLSALYRLDLRSQAIEKLHGFEAAEVSGVVTDLSGREAIGAYGYADRTVYHWLAPEHPAAKLRAALLRAFPNQDVSITSATHDGALAVVFVSSDVNPGDYYLFDTKTMRADFLRATRNWIDPRVMRPKTPVEFAARDGLELHGYLTRPPGEGPHPLVVLLHGGPHGIRDAWEFDWEVQLLASRGYAVLQVNYRGSGGYGIDFLEAGYKQWGALMQDDVTDATRWAIEQRFADPNRICIFGGSYGGYAALMGAAREPDLYRCAIGYAGVYDLQLMLTSADIPDSRAGQSYLAKALGSDPADLKARSPVHNAARIKAPVLLIHGAKDWRADYEQATRMKAALDKAGKQVEWIPLSREGHGVVDEESRRDVYERLIAFLDRHLKGAAGGAE